MLENSPRPYDAGKQLLTQSIMLEMDISLDPWPDESCVLILFYGPKYVIIKGKSLSLAIELFKKGYAYHIGYNHIEGKHAPSIYEPLYEYIKLHPGAVFSIYSVHLGTPYELLRQEQDLLWSRIGDKNCMNTNIDAYVPKWNPKTKLYGGWIPKHALMNFRKYVKTANSKAV